MVLNLAFHRILTWILADPKRLAGFKAVIPSNLPKRSALTISRIDDFKDLKEAGVIEICRTAKLLSKNVVETLREKLKRRNTAAHPSMMVITQYQADDTITDLVNNVISGLQ